MTIQQARAPDRLQVKPLPLSAQQEEWLQRAYAEIDAERMTRFNVDVVSHHSPCGFERKVNEWMVSYMAGLGMEAHYQKIDEHSGNAIGYIRGSDPGPTLMLYAPVDTHLEGDPEADVPWCGPELRPDMVPTGYVDGNGNVIGLGASNPKGMVTAVMAAVEAVKRAEVPLKGDVVAAFCGGGMPFHASPQHERQNVGMGSGVLFMVQQGVTADFGIIVKPGYAVYWEEPGLAWFKVTVHGYLGYAGFPHDMPGYKSAIFDMARVVVELEDWLATYPERNTSGLVAAQGAIGAIRAGVPHKVALPSGAAEIYLDIRINPRSTPLDVKRQLEEELERIRAKYPDISMDCKMIAAYPSASTDPEHWIVQSAARGWEHVEGSSHPAPRQMSGQTDASIIRNLGIPLARIGQPAPVPGTPEEWSRGLGGMGVSYIPDLVKVSKILVYAIIDSCTRTTEEVGLTD